MSSRRAMSLLATMIAASAWMTATPAWALLTLNCNWGIGPFVPVAFPHSTQVMMMPVVMDFGSPPFSFSQVAFISFATASQGDNDRGGVLRIVDGNCRTIASFPDLALPPLPIPLGCPPNLNSIPRLAPVSGLAAGNTDLFPNVEIVAVIDDPINSNHRQLIAFNLKGGFVGGRLVPKWCSTPLPSGDHIPKYTTPAIAHLDKTGTPSQHMSQIVIDNKVFEGDGTLRFTGGAGPRSSAAVVANVAGSFLPQVITGRGIYKSSSGPVWTGMPVSILSSAVGLGPYTFAAVAELDPTSPGPEIVVTDYLVHKVHVLKAAGGLLASALVPGSGGGHAGGPPMIANVTNFGTVIGVAGVSMYTLFRYIPGSPPSLHVIWSMPTDDPSGATTSTFYDTPSGPSIYYADAKHLWVFSVINNGTVLDSQPNTSATVFEGPVIAAFDTGPAPGRVIVAASNYLTIPPFSPSAQRGLRIFWDSAIGPAHSYWNQHTYHATNVTNSFGSIPFVELPSWSPLGHNTYRVQQWP